MSYQKEQETILFYLEITQRSVYSKAMVFSNDQKYACGVDKESWVPEN